MADEDEDEDEDEDPSQMATLELTILCAQDLKDTTFLGKKMKSFVVAWVDPRLKKSTKTLTSKNPSWNFKLSFPLPPQTLQNPTSILTLQILSSHSRVVGSAILAISSIRPDIHTFTLQLWRPSGRAKGLLTVSARMSSPNPRAFAFHGCVTGIPVASDPTMSALFPDRDVLGQSGCYNQVLPTAPPLPAEQAGDNARRNFLIGLLSGAVAAAVLVGSAIV